MANASSDELRVLVVGAGFGTNAGLGLEVPLQHGKLLTDGSGGVVAVTAEVRRKRVLDPGFLGFMGKEFWYLWERPDGYLGNAGFIYGALLKDPRLQVDMLQHPVTEADKCAVYEASSHTREVVNAALSAEASSLRLSGGSQSYAASLAKLVNDGGYQVVLAASKGIAQLLLAMSSIALPVGVVLLNGAEPPAAMDVGASSLGARGPDFAQLGKQFLAHPQVPRLVLTSHGAEVSVQLRKAAVGLAREISMLQEHNSQRLALFSCLDHRCVPNRENHSLPWSLTFPFECWHPGFGKPEPLVFSDGATITASNQSILPPLIHLLYWAAGGPDHLLSLPQFPGPRRFAQLFVETMDLPGSGIFAPVVAPKGPSVQANSCESAGGMGSPDAEIFDILFDAQAWEMQVVLKSVKSGSQTPIAEILVKEGQYATRRIRFFRYYEEKSRKISMDGDLNDKMQWSQHMIHELLAMNKNLGNYLWTGFMTPATAVPRFGSDLMELVIEAEDERNPFLAKI